MRRLLIGDDDERIYALFEERFKKEGFEFDQVLEPQRVIEQLRARTYDIVLLDLDFGPGRPRAGFEVQKAIRQDSKLAQIPIIIITAHPGIEEIKIGRGDGAVAFCAKPFDFAQLVAKLRKLTETQTSAPTPAADWKDEIKFVSPVMSEIVNRVYQAAQAEVDTLFLGDNGVGKDKFAKLFHQYSNRSFKPFLSVNCGALTKETFVTELFGARRGSYTDSKEDRKGLIKRAEGGIVLLNEIGDLSLENQVKLLSFFEEEKRIQPLGAEKNEQVDVVVLAATNCNLAEMLEKGMFRKDLYHRFRNPLRIPSLREHTEDIPVLVEHFLRKYNQAHLRQVSLAPGLVNHLQMMPWGGNVRELEYCLQNCVINCLGNQITLLDIQNALANKNSHESAAPADPALNTEQPFADFKAQVRKITGSHYKKYLEEQLARHGGNKTKTSDAMQISRKRLDQLMEEYGVGKFPI